MSGSARPTGWGSAWAEGRVARRRPHTLESHPDFTPIFESKGLTIRPILRGDLLPSKQVVAGSIPVSRSNAGLDVTTHARRRPPKGGLLLFGQEVRAWLTYCHPISHSRWRLLMPLSR